MSSLALRSLFPLYALRYALIVLGTTFVVPAVDYGASIGAKKNPVSFAAKLKNTGIIKLNQFSIFLL